MTKPAAFAASARALSDLAKLAAAEWKPCSVDDLAQDDGLDYHDLVAEDLCHAEIDATRIGVRWAEKVESEVSASGWVLRFDIHHYPVEDVGNGETGPAIEPSGDMETTSYSLRVDFQEPA